MVFIANDGHQNTVKRNKEVFLLQKLFFFFCYQLHFFPGIPIIESSFLSRRSILFYNFIFFSGMKIIPSPLEVGRYKMIFHYHPWKFKAGNFP